MRPVLIAAALVFASPSVASPVVQPLELVICRAKSPSREGRWTSLVAAQGISVADHAELLFKIGLLEGHLMVGRELIEAGQPRLALPHFGHPVRELYDDIQSELKRRGVVAFDTDLIALEAQVVGKARDASTMTRFDAVIRTIHLVRATVPDALLNDTRFMLGVLGEVATIASEDYSESIEGGRIEKAVEYHDSRGYLAYASQELRRLEQARPSPQAALREARARLVDMQAIVGSLLPPALPVKSVAAYKSIVSQFKQSAATGA